MTAELVSLGGIGTDTACAGCKWVKISVSCEEHTLSTYRTDSIFSLSLGTRAAGGSKLPSTCLRRWITGGCWRSFYLALQSNSTTNLARVSKSSIGVHQSPSRVRGGDGA